MDVQVPVSLPLLVYVVAIIVLVSAMLVLSYLLGPRHRERYTDTPYESGMPLTGSARLRLSIKFYLVAMFFVLFDLESVFVFAWAVSARQAGWAGYIEIVIFVGILVVGLAYLWRLGALDWGSSTRVDPKLTGGSITHVRMAE